MVVVFVHLSIYVLTMNKSGIKELLENWYFLQSTESIFISTYLVATVQALESLVKKRQLDSTDIQIIENFKCGYNMSEIASQIGVTRQAVSKRLDRTAGLLLIELGD